MSGQPLIVFDVNETLLDLAKLEPTFERIFGERSVTRLWFVNLVMYSMALTAAGFLRAIHGYRLRRHEDARGHAWLKNSRSGQEGAYRELFYDVTVPGSADGVIQAPLCGLSAVHAYEQSG